MSDQLERLILTIDARLAAVAEAYGDIGDRDWDRWRERQAQYRTIIDDLVTNERAKYREGTGDAFSLTIAGVRTSCTSGDHGLLSGWLGRARRHVEQLKAVA